MSVLNYGAEAASVAFEEIASLDWAENVYRPEIRGKWDNIYVKPGYNPLEE